MPNNKPNSNSPAVRLAQPSKNTVISSIPIKNTKLIHVNKHIKAIKRAKDGKITPISHIYI